MIPTNLTGNLLRAGRSLARLTRDDLANRAGLSRDVLGTWEVSSDRVVPAQYQTLCRAIEALEAIGVRFSGDGLPAARLPSTPNDSEGVHVANGPGCSASVTPAV
jgi:DNA-binding XRE family transcriptional regulator